MLVQCGFFQSFNWSKLVSVLPNQKTGPDQTIKHCWPLSSYNSWWILPYALAQPSCTISKGVLSKIGTFELTWMLGSYYTLTPLLYCFKWLLLVSNKTFIFKIYSLVWYTNPKYIELPFTFLLIIEKFWVEMASNFNCINLEIDGDFKVLLLVFITFLPI